MRRINQNKGKKEVEERGIERKRGATMSKPKDMSQSRERKRGKTAKREMH